RTASVSLRPFNKSSTEKAMGATLPPSGNRSFSTSSRAGRITRMRSHKSRRERRLDETPVCARGCCGLDGLQRLLRKGARSAHSTGRHRRYGGYVATGSPRHIWLCRGTHASDRWTSGSWRKIFASNDVAATNHARTRKPLHGARTAPPRSDRGRHEAG